MGICPTHRYFCKREPIPLATHLANQPLNAPSKKTSQKRTNSTELGGKSEITSTSDSKPDT